MISLCLSRYDASTDMQYDLLMSSGDLELRLNIDLTFQGYHGYFSSRHDEWNTMASELRR